MIRLRVLARFQVEKEISSKNINSATAEIAAEKICEQHPELEACLKTIKFKPKYFRVFFKHKGWKTSFGSGAKSNERKNTLRKRS